MFRDIKAMPALVLTLLLAACGGSETAKEVLDNGGETTDAVITDKNALDVAQHGAKSLNGVATMADDLHGVMDQFNMMSGGHGDLLAATKYTASATEETINCPAGGTLTLSAETGSAGEQIVRYLADQCESAAGEVIDGELVITSAAWSEYPQGGIELTMATGDNGLSSGSCGFEGGLVMRIASQPATEQYGENLFVYEYGATDAGFDAVCEPDQAVHLEANTLAHHEFRYAYNPDGGMTVSNAVSFEGSIDTGDGEIMEIVANDLEYGVDDSGESLYGTPGVCPISGSVTVTAEDGTSVSMYFGDDAPSGYAVQVTGPDGYVEEFETCEDFLATAS